LSKVDEIKILIIEYELDPWLLNNNKQTSFDVIDLHIYPDLYNDIYSIWTKYILHKRLLNNNYNKNNNIFNIIKYIIDETTSTIFINNITKYI
jgi:hypothetical protein